MKKVVFIMVCLASLVGCSKRPSVDEFVVAKNQKITVKCDSALGFSTYSIYDGNFRVVDVENEMYIETSRFFGMKKVTFPIDDCSIHPEIHKPKYIEQSNCPKQLIDSSPAECLFPQ